MFKPKHSFCVGVGWTAVIVAILGFVAVSVWRAVTVERLVARVEALNGAIGVDHGLFTGPTEVVFSVIGRMPLSTDKELIEIAPDLVNFSVLERLGLTRVPVSDKGLEALLNSCGRSLKEIELSGTNVSEDVFALLAHCPYLKNVSIPGELLTPAGINGIVAIKSLRILYVYGIHEDDQRVKELQKLRPDVAIYVRPCSDLFDISN